MRVHNITEDFILVTNSQDIEHILESIGKSEAIQEYGSLYVKAENGDYVEVYGCTSNIPKNDSFLDPLKGMYQWTSSSGEIELDIPEYLINDLPNSGSQDACIHYISEHAYVHEQLENLDPKVVDKVVADYGIENTNNLERTENETGYSAEQNLQYLLWIACGDARDEQAA